LGPPHLKRVAALPCEICLQEIVILKNCVDKLPRKTQTAIQDSPAENFSRKNYLTNDMSTVKFADEKILPSNSHNNWLYAAAATNKKGLCNKILSHIINVQWKFLTTVGKTKSVYTSLIII